MSSIWQTNKHAVFLALLAGLSLLFVVPVLTYIYFANDLQSKESIMNRNNTGLILLDRNDKPFFTFYEPRQTVFVPLEQIPKDMQYAVIAAEDKDFYHHPGFSVPAMIRSLINDVRNQNLDYGGSTITQQLVKNALLSPKRNFLRKYQEIILAQEIERRYSKQEILEMYLNSVYFGEGAFGVEEAAQTYFGVYAKDLTLAQASLLAGILPAPSTYSPFSGSRDQAIKHQHMTLDQMREQDFITPQETVQAISEPLIFKARAKTSEINSTAPHFALMVRDQLITKYGEEQISRSGFTVRTTLDWDWQTYAETVVAKQVENLKTSGVTNGAAVVIDPKTGQVPVLVGSANWFDDKFGKVNIATSSRPPGSSFKPIVYAKAFSEHLITPATILRDEPTTFPENYKPQNYDRKFRGPVTVRRALSNSLNVPAVQVMQKVGVQSLIPFARELGISTLHDPAYYGYGLSLVLGTAEIKPLELTNIYATFANQGTQYDITLITQISDKQNRVIYAYSPHPKQLIDPAVTFLISSILSDNAARAEAFGNTLTISRPAAVKTGTTEDYKDAWTMGYTPSIAIGTWVGNNDNKPMNQIAGSLGAAPIWKSLMEHYLKGTPVEHFSPPSGVIRTIPCNTSRQVIATSSAIFEYILVGTQISGRCTLDNLPTDLPLTPTPIQSPTSTITPTPQPKADPPLAETPTSTPTPTPEEKKKTIKIELNLTTTPTPSSKDNHQN